MGLVSNVTLALVKSHDISITAEVRPLIEAFDRVAVEVGGFLAAVEFAKEAKIKARKVFFIGNGGSAAIASHMAADYLKNGSFRALAFNDPASLTCLANDLGYEHVFAAPLGLHAKADDLLFAISSSGKSASILRAALQAKQCGVTVITLSGITPDNPLRMLGAINFYVPSRRYAVVEDAHQAILHAILDRVMNVDAG